MESHAIDWRKEFRRGFLAMMPLWLGVAPFAMAFALLAHTNGFSEFETMSLSLFVFAGSAQLAIVDQPPEQIGIAAILLTVLLLNLRHVLYGITLDLRLARPRTIPKPVLAAGMTDEGMGLTIVQSQSQPATDWFYMGTVVSIASCFFGGTLFGIVLGSRIPDPGRYHLDFVFPLVFLALLLPLARSRRSLTIALAATVVSVTFRSVIGASNAILAAILVGALVGFVLPADERERAIYPSEDLPA